MGIRLAIDTGDTFTDLVALDEYLSEEAARDVCGAVLEGDPPLHVDEAKTTRLREA